MKTETSYTSSPAPYYPSACNTLGHNFIQVGVPASIHLQIFLFVCSRCGQDLRVPVNG